VHCTYPLAPGLTRLLVKPNQPAPLSYVYRAVKGVNTNESDWHAAATAVQLSSVTSESRWEVNDVADGYCAFKCACLRLMVVKVLVFADWQNECKTSMLIIVLQWRSIFSGLELQTTASTVTKFGDPTPSTKEYKVRHLTGCQFDSSL